MQISREEALLRCIFGEKAGDPPATPQRDDESVEECMARQHREVADLPEREETQ